jgi:hypothetical protein
MMATVAALAALGVQSFSGTLWAWWAERNDPSWASGGNEAFIEVMNGVAAPLVVGLVVLLGLCVPKRVLQRRALAYVSVGMVAAGGVVWALTGDPARGLGAYLLVASAFQAVVLGMTYADAPGLSYLTEGRLVRIGSGLLHLGFLLFAYVVVALQDSQWMLPVFWLASGLLVGGSALSFYAGPIARRSRTED